MTKELTPEQQIQWDAAMAIPTTRGELFAALSVINNAVVAITNHSLAISLGNREGLNAPEKDMLSARSMLSNHVSDFIMRAFNADAGG